MKRLFLPVLGLISSPALAASLAFQVTSLVSPKVNGVRSVILMPGSAGKIHVQINLNTCSENGGCSELPVITKLVEPILIKDQRPADGPLLVALTPELRLSIGSGFNPEGIVTFDAYLTYPDGSERRLSLSPLVAVDLAR